MSVFHKFEPFSSETVDRDEALVSAAVSQAISLKRIADSLAKIEAKLPGDVGLYRDHEHYFDEASKQR